MKKLYIIIFSILIGNLCNLGFAQRNHSIPKEIKDAFTAKTDSVGNQIIQYRETLISPEASDSAALILLSGMCHVDACNRAFSSQNLDILFSKHR